MSDLLILSAFPSDLEGDQDAALEVLTAEAERFLLAGGTITLETWKGLTGPSRDALAKAGEGLRLAQAAALSVSIHSPQVAALCAADLDPDEIHLRAALEASGDRQAKGASK